MNEFGTVTHDYTTPLMDDRKRRATKQVKSTVYRNRKKVAFIPNPKWYTAYGGWE